MNDNNQLNRRQMIKLIAAGSGLLLVGCGADRDHSKLPPYDIDKHNWGYAVDTTRCIGCNSCMRACRAENDVPPGYYRTWVERYRFRADGEVHVDVATNDHHVFEPIDGTVVKAYFVPKLCNHCEKSVCTQVCPVGAAYHTPDGVVLVDEQHCIGCGYCVQACPYGCRFIDPDKHVAAKCTLCYHRITRGLIPACVQSCPREARIFGDLMDPGSKLVTLLKQRRHGVLRPDMGTHPRCVYLGLDQEVV
jgi:Fe-S-cluster-containing dehydrogenase component